MLQGFARHSWAKLCLTWSIAGFDTVDKRPLGVLSNQGFCLLPCLSKLFHVRMVYSYFFPGVFFFFFIALLFSLHQFYSASSVSKMLLLSCAIECGNGEYVYPPHLSYNHTSWDLLLIIKRALHFSGTASQWHILLLSPITFCLQALSLRFAPFTSLQLSGVPVRICTFILMLVWAQHSSEP